MAATIEHEDGGNAAGGEEVNWENALKKLGFNFGVLSYLVLSKSGVT